MALTSAQIDHISNLASIAEKFKQMYPDLILLNDEWAGVPDFDTLITQPEIDAIPQLLEANITMNDLTEVNYIVANLLPFITGRLAQVVRLAKIV